MPEETECQAASQEADGAPITGFVPEDVAALVTLAQKCATAIGWHHNSPLLQHVSFDEVIFMEDPVTAAGKDETAFANLGYEILAQGPHGPLVLTCISSRPNVRGGHVTPSHANRPQPR